MPEIDARRIDGIAFAEADDFLHRADLRDFPHRFGTEFQVLHVVEIDVVPEDFQPVLRLLNRFLALRLALRRGMKDDAFPAHQLHHFSAVQNVAVGLRRHLVVGIGKIDEIGRMNGQFSPLRLKRLADRDRLFLAHAHAPPEGIFEAVQPPFFHKCRRLLRVRKSRRIKTFRIAARPEFYHCL